MLCTWARGQPLQGSEEARAPTWEQVLVVGRQVQDGDKGVGAPSLVILKPDPWAVY